MTYAEKTCLCIFSNSQFIVRWIPSELNPADKSSRLPGVDHGRKLDLRDPRSRFSSAKRSSSSAKKSHFIVPAGEIDSHCALLGLGDTFNAEPILPSGLAASTASKGAEFSSSSSASSSSPDGLEEGDRESDLL